MKILLINYAYFKMGGPETYMFNVKALLESHGHEVIPFSLNYEMNEPCEYDEYFADPPGPRNAFFYEELSGGIGLRLKLLARQFFSRQVYRNLQRLIDDTQPDVAHVIHFTKRLSPAVLDACYSRNIPTVLFFSDFGLMCIKNVLFREGRPCFLCKDSVWRGVQHRCVKNSWAASLMTFLAQRVFYLRRMQRKVGSVICPSGLMAEMFRNYPPFRNTSIHHVPTFAPLGEYVPWRTDDPVRSKISYWGRMDPDKGVDLIIRAAEILQSRGVEVVFNLIGKSSDEATAVAFRHDVESKGLRNVRILGRLPREKMLEEIHDSWGCVVPSRCVDNMPLSLVEGQAMGLPVIVPDSGTFPEFVSEGKNGMFFRPGDAESLADCVERLIETPRESVLEMRKNSIAWVAEICSTEKYYKKLIGIFSSAINRNKQNVDK